MDKVEVCAREREKGARSVWEKGYVFGVCIEVVVAGPKADQRRREGSGVALVRYADGSQGCIG